MNSIFKDNWTIPNITDSLVLDVLIYLECNNIIKYNTSNTCYTINDCHNNVNKYIKINNKAERVLGYYILINKNKNKLFLIQHSNILENDKIIDITPCIFSEKLFIYGDNLIKFKHFIYDGSIKDYEPSAII